MKILIASSECHPLMRVDDVADFVASLVRVIGQSTHDVRLIMPAYPQALEKARPVEELTRIEFAGCEEPVRLLRGELPEVKVPVYLVDAPLMFARHGHPYRGADGQQRVDNLKRYAFFSQAVTSIALNHAGVGWKPDIIHCNDWQTGLVPAMLAQEWNRPACVFSCHRFSPGMDFEMSQALPLKLPQALKDSAFCHAGELFSPTMAALHYADAVVSPCEALPSGYQAYQATLSQMGRRLLHIADMLDDSRWNPANDDLISQPYDADSIELKQRNKQALQKSLDLNADEKQLLISVFAEISAGGNDTAENAAGKTPERIPLEFLQQLLDRHEQLQIALQCVSNLPLPVEKQLAAAYPGRVGLALERGDKPLHRLIGGSDAALFANSGLMTRQLPRICCVYGTVPMLPVKDACPSQLQAATSENLMRGKANAFFYNDNTVAALSETAERLVAYHARSGPWWKKLAANCMQQFDVQPQQQVKFSGDYLECYQFAIDNPVSNPDRKP